MPRLHRNNSQHQQQGTAPGHHFQQPQPASSQAAHQTRPAPRFGPDYSAASGFSPAFRATPPTARGFGSSFRSPLQRLGMRAAGGSLSADSKTKVLDKLMEDLSMHQPYDPLPPTPTQQSSVSTTTQVDLNLDLDAVIARYAFRTNACKGGISFRVPSEIACHDYALMVRFAVHLTQSALKLSQCHSWPDPLQNLTLDYFAHHYTDRQKLKFAPFCFVAHCLQQGCLWAVTFSCTQFLQICFRAKGVRKDSQTSLKQAATKEAEMVAQHKSSMRCSQAAQSPLPPLYGKGAPTPAQPRRRTAKVSSKAFCFSSVGSTAYKSSMCSSPGQGFKCKICKTMLTLLLVSPPRVCMRRWSSMFHTRTYGMSAFFMQYTCLQTDNGAGQGCTELNMMDSTGYL